LLANLGRLKDRIWIPHQVGLEYQRGRIGVLLGQRRLVSDLQAAIDGAAAQIKRLSRGDLFEVNTLVEPLQKQLSKIRNGLDKKKPAEPDLMYGDSILNALTEIFADAVGPEYPKD